MVPNCSWRPGLSLNNSLANRSAHDRYAGVLDIETERLLRPRPLNKSPILETVPRPSSLS